jgi:uncharacterized SAM-binding protein YcdF (DUF218 family)
MIYVISKLFTYLCLPPGIFVLVMFYLSIKTKHKKFFLFITLSFWFFSTYIGASILLKPLENKEFADPLSKPEIVIVLGGGETKKIKNLPLQAGATERVLVGLMIAKELNLPLLYSGCEADSAKITIKQITKSFDIKIKKIFFEGKSKDTYENAKYSLEEIKKLHYKPSVILVTSAFHAPRAYYLFKYFGFEVFLRKSDYKIGVRKYKIWDIFPSMGSLEKSYTALHEYIGLASLFLRGIV